MLIRRLLLTMLLVLGAMAARAQTPPAVLVADRVYVSGNELVAEGHVEALFDGTRIQAERIVYDSAANRLRVDGPIRMTEDSGRVIVLADSAELDRDLQNGLILGARMVMDEQLQLAAARMDRVGVRYVQLSRAAVTSCQVCGRDGVPLWQIQARRVIHDRQERQLYFDSAQFRVLDVPVFWLPRLRMPDPTLKRARGFLIPTARSTSRLGLGFKLPYFLPIGKHQDLTLTPYLSPVTRKLEFRYRRAYGKGDVIVTGAATRDTLLPGQNRGYLFAEGNFALPRDFRLRFDIELATDSAYLADYGYSSKDRLDSAVVAARARRDAYTEAGLVHYESLRNGENNATQPTIIGDVFHEQRLFPKWAGGEIRLGAEAHSHFRYSDLDVDSADADSLVDGRDLTRIGVTASWRNRWTLAGGLRLGALAQVNVDRFWIGQDSARPDHVLAVTPALATELRWPLMRRGAGGVSHLLEPVAQLAWSGGTRPDLANDESTRVEFDEGNLLSLSRFPAADRREHGLRLAYGLRYLRQDPAGWNLGLTLGQVIRAEADNSFTSTSGLESTRSDLLIAAQFSNARGLRLGLRSLLGPRLDVTRAEARAGWTNNRLTLDATYVLLARDAAEDRPRATAEWSLDTAYRIGRHWTTSALWRYDLVGDRTARMGVGLEYRNECVEVDLSVSRSFVTSTNVEPSTDFGLTVELKGFGTGTSDASYRRTCRN